MFGLFEGKPSKMSDDDLATQKHLLERKELRGKAGQDARNRVKAIEAEQSTRAEHRALRDRT